MTCVNRRPEQPAARALLREFSPLMRQGQSPCRPLSWLVHSQLMRGHDKLQPTPWNEQTVDLLKKLWAEGLSASAIAARLGGISRNAVIGKQNRLKLPGRATTVRRSPRTKAAAKKVARVVTLMAVAKSPSTRGAISAAGGVDAWMRAKLAEGPQPPTLPAPVAEPVIPIAERKTVQTLEDCDCRWPIGDPQVAGFHFCGKGKVAGLPYCEFHARRAFRPPEPRRPFEPGRQPAKSLLSRRFEVV